jgi:GAF domain-containing protein
MPANRHNLKLDEQSFQRLLWAAFTIQECSYRRKLARQTPARQTQAEAEPHSEPEADRLWQHHGALMPADAEETIGQEKTETIYDRAFDASALDKAEAKSQWITASTKLLNCVPNHLLREIVQQALQATHATGAAIALEQQGKLICRAAAGDSASEIGAMINTGSGFTGRCASSGTMQLCSNTVLDSRVDADACRKLGVSAIIVVPLLHQDQLLGLIAVFSRRPYAFGMRDLQALQDLAENTSLLAV